jgi:tetratricopeptide (TPR) repeat protein
VIVHRKNQNENKPLGNPRACFLMVTLPVTFAAAKDFKSVHSMHNADQSRSTEGIRKQVSSFRGERGESEANFPPSLARRSFKWLRSLLVFSVLLGGGTIAYRFWKTAMGTWYESQCREARNDRKWLDLRKFSERWSALEPLSADAKLFEADADTHLQDFESAAECLSAIPESHPKSLPSLVALSTMQFGPLGRPLDGVRTCERILKIDRRVTAAHHQLIEFYAVTLQRRKLEEQIRFAIDCSREPPKAYIYLFLIDTMRIAGASESNARWFERDPESEQFAVAQVLHMPEPDNGIRKPTGDDKFSLAEALFKRYPTNLELLAYNLDVTLRSGDQQGVLLLLSSLPPEADNDNRFWRAKGWLHLNRNELTKAKESLNEAIRLFPMDWNARNLLADVLRKEGRLSEAEDLHDLVQTARKLRIRVNSISLDEEIPTEVLTDLARLAERCGDLQISGALKRRLGLSISGVDGGI